MHTIINNCIYLISKRTVIFMIRIASIEPESTIDGEGWRYVILHKVVITIV